MTDIPFFQSDENFIKTSQNNDLDDFSQENTAESKYRTSEKDDNYFIFGNIDQITNEEDNFNIFPQQLAYTTLLTQIPEDDCIKIKAEEGKKGRLSKNAEIPQKKYHSKNRRDNIITKLKVWFVKFVVYFLNGVIKGDLFIIQDIFFRHIDYTIKKNTNISANKKFFNLTLEEFIRKYNLSKKYKKKSIQSNVKVLEEIQNEMQTMDYKEKFDNLLKKKLKTIFTDIYLSTNPNIFIDEYKINNDNSKIKFFCEQIDELKQKGEELYAEKIFKVSKDFIQNYETKTPRKMCDEF